MIIQLTYILIIRQQLVSLYNLVQHERTKHIEVNRHFVKEKLNENRHIRHLFPLEVSLPIYLLKQAPKKDSILSKLGMTDIYAPTCAKV